MIATFDFDDTLCSEEGIPNLEIINLVKNYFKKGYKCYIVTARNKSHDTKKWIKENNPKRVRILDFIKIFELPIEKIYYTNHELKGPILAKLGSKVHYDDHEDQIKSCKEHKIKVYHPNNIDRKKKKK
jgi:hydroxymethylpyrimidine pyrophosphatase-like HAD family hydrolase